MKTVFVGIAGGSGSGKTYLARRVMELAGEGVAAVISMDQYFRTPPAIDSAEINFDHPNHLDLDLLHDHITELAQGKSVTTPTYDFATRQQTLRALPIPPVPVVIVEGLFVLSSPIVDLLDISCFLDVSDDQRLLGRILRDTRERGGNVANLIDRYQRFVRPSYHVFVAPTKQNADVVVDFTYRRALFTHMLAHIVRDYAAGQVDLVGMMRDIGSENNTLGYRADQSVMPMAIDIRELGRAFPESVLPGADSRFLLHQANHRSEEE